MNKIKLFTALLIGCGIGSGVTYYVLKDKMEKELDTEIEQIKRAYEIKSKTEPEEKKEEEIEHSEPVQLKKFDKGSITDYTNYSTIIKKEEYTEKKEKTMSPIDGEIIIEPDFVDGIIGFGLEPFNIVFATIYADGYLVDDSDHIIDIDQIGGVETLEHFGEGDDPELLHVRNTLYELDYEIDRDTRTYAEVSGKDPSELPDLNE